MSKIIPSRVYDFTDLKKPPSSPDNKIKPKVHPMRKISASKLFINQKEEGYKRQTGSEPNIHAPKHNPNYMNVQLGSESSVNNVKRYPRKGSEPIIPSRNKKPEHNYTNNSSEPIIFLPNQKTPEPEEVKVQKRIASQPNLLSAHNELYSTILNNVYSLSSDDIFESHRHSGIFDGGGKRPWSEKMRKADNCVACWNEAWQDIINDFDKSNKLDSKTLEAVYLLRNAHKSGFFQSSDEESNTPSSDESIKTGPHVPNGGQFKNGNFTTRASVNTNMKPVYISRSMSESLSSDERTSSVEYSTNGRDSALSSGRSTPSFRKKPKRPDIKLSDHQNFPDYVEIRRTDSLTSMDSEMDRYSFISDSNSYIDIPYYNEQNNTGHHHCNGEEKVHEFEETLRDDNTPIPGNNTDSRYNYMKKICRERPDSPTSSLLLPILMSNIGDPMAALHEKLSPILNKLKLLEEESRQIPSLRSQISILEEEREKLTTTLQKQETLQIASPSCHKQTLTDVNVTSNRDKETNIYVLKTNQHRATVPKKSLEIETQTLINESTSIDTQIDSISSPELYQNIGIQSVPITTETGVQKYLEFITEISHKGVGTEHIETKTTATGDGVAELPVFDGSTQCSVQNGEFACQNDISLSTNHKQTETISRSFVDKSIGDKIADLRFHSIGIQESPRHFSSSTQCETNPREDFETMCGSPTSQLTNFGVGDNIAYLHYDNQNTQTIQTEYKNESTQMTITSNDKSISTGCSFNSMTSSSTQHGGPATNDFSCGENKADVRMCDQSSSNVPTVIDSGVGTDAVQLVDSSVGCNIKTETRSIGVGNDRIDDILCAKCLVPKSTIGIGMYVNCKFCTIDDKLCDCVKPVTTSVGVGDISIDKINCDKCENLKQVSVSVGEGTVDDLLCDSCEKTRNNGTTSTGVGDGDINETDCEKCKNSNSDNVFNFDFNVLNKPASTQHEQQQAALCHYCGNKVDLNDTQLDESLQAMRDSMKSVSCGMKRTTASKNLNLELESAASDSIPRAQQTSDDDLAAVSDEEVEEEESPSGRNDVIEACQMLHEHFSGQKPLKQPIMMKYVGIIQALWFKAVKRRRSNASVVKSYLDLFQQRIPELLEMIVNLSDDEGNTALHYALTYKNLGVVSILLDSGECCVDLANQAGYSPVMLAALAGFENKNDKYIMQRLFRLGEVNKESAESGQTPLMLAVSRGNLGIIELLLDAGCDINAIDDEGSTALMCACEHGNINIVKTLLGHPDCDATLEDNEGSTALSIAMDARRKDLALLVYGSLNFDARGRIKLSPSKKQVARYLSDNGRFSNNGRHSSSTGRYNDTTTLLIEESEHFFNDSDRTYHTGHLFETAGLFDNGHFLNNGRFLNTGS